MDYHKSTFTYRGNLLSHRVSGTLRELSIFASVPYSQNINGVIKNFVSQFVSGNDQPPDFGAAKAVKTSALSRGLTELRGSLMKVEDNSSSSDRIDARDKIVQSNQIAHGITRPINFHRALIRWGAEIHDRCPGFSPMQRLIHG